MKRTFIAIPVAVSSEFYNFLSLLKEQLKGEAINWVDPSNLHLTVKFLGDTPDHLIAPVARLLGNTVSGFSQEQGWLRGLDYFSYKGNPSVLFARLEGLLLPEKIAAVLDAGLEELGFPMETRKFNAHLTLARIKFQKDKRGFSRLTDQYKEREIQPVSLEKVVFFESLLFPDGPVYKPITIVPLTSK
ncbi:MAG: RNA 2',3'-cyclic phosphodiesterase [Prolixibacteraceae bacterium]|nr:RNA 2',3'-cyclic phosphodiesterase [Prolixibacteraceae bacterium]HPI35599.1 RNA 2',3'-cyclic phosphodiesterase [Prolixibacteraceae bacterium]